MIYTARNVLITKDKILVIILNIAQYFLFAQL